MSADFSGYLRNLLTSAIWRFVWWIRTNISD